MPHAHCFQPVEVHYLRVDQLDVPRNEEGSRGLIVPLALHPSLQSIMAWEAGHGGTSATSATTLSLSYAVGSAATRKWCLRPGLLTAAYKLSRALHISAGGGEVSPQFRS